MANEANGDMGNAWMNAHSAGSGPFSLQDYRPAELVRLTAFPDYFNGAPKIDSVIIRHVAESATQQLLLQQGDVDMAKNLTPDQIAGLPADTIKVEIFPQAAVHFLSLQPEGRGAAARGGLGGGALPRRLQGDDRHASSRGRWRSTRPSGRRASPARSTTTPYSYDPEKAKQILADAGVKTPINVTLDVINSAPFTDMAQSLQASFAEAGINFEILPGTGSQVITKYRERSHEAMLLYWGPDFMDPHSNAKAFAYNADNSDDAYAATTTWRNAWAVPEEMNALTWPPSPSPIPTSGWTMYVDLQKQVQAKSPIVIMFQAAYQVAMDKDVTGYVNGATSDFVFYRLVEKS